MGLKKRSKVSAEFNMSSLTDIIFLLLIFFMLTSTLVNPNALNLALPESNSTAPSPQTFSLSITTDGEYFIDKDPVPYVELERKLRARIRQYEEEELIEADKVTIVLNVEQEVRTGNIVDIMKMANRLGAKMIMATNAKE